MKKIRCFLAAIALLASLSGPLLQGMGSLANAASSRHASSVSSQFAINRYPPCPVPGTSDCQLKTISVDWLNVEAGQDDGHHPVLYFAHDPGQALDSKRASYFRRDFILFAPDFQP